MSYVQVTRWVKKFKDGQEGVDDDLRSGRPSTSRNEANVNRARELMNSDQRLSVRFLADTFYVDVVERLRTRVLRVRKDVAGTWLLHHDNAPSHTSLRVREYLAKHNLGTLPQPPYSPYPSPPDFFLFPRIKTVLKGHRFETTEDIQKAVTTFLNEDPVEKVQGAYQSWVKR